ncbi:hypothetical protein Asera_44650 [Actinocatenispora sera]|uniref:Uncharacterized protein n=1 Tax=Actinocatenispora sera TaxID=390989 RepID=A0A810L547_9ACTN|nr:hypothetical protein Asera_44650 [Actinocatenispora sera]
MVQNIAAFRARPIRTADSVSEATRSSRAPPQPNPDSGTGQRVSPPTRADGRPLRGEAIQITAAGISAPGDAYLDLAMHAPRSRAHTPVPPFRTVFHDRRKVLPTTPTTPAKVRHATDP